MNGKGGDVLAQTDEGRKDASTTKKLTAVVTTREWAEFHIRAQEQGLSIREALAKLVRQFIMGGSDNGE